MKRLILVLFAAFWMSPVFSQINLVEYFINVDPGYGKGIQVSVTNGDLVEKDFNIPLSLPNGFHTVGFRTKSSDGKWSHTILRNFFVKNEVANSLKRIEYFIDNEPGIGKAIEIPLTIGENGYVNFNIPLNEYSEGFHLLGIRTNDNSGHWSQTLLKVFYNKKGNSPSHIIRLEYFFTGEGAPNTVFTYNLPQPSSLVDLDWIADLSGLPANKTYTINIIAVDENGLKSSPMTAEFFVRPPISIEKVDVTNLACFGVNSGKSVITALGTGMTLEYSIDNTTFKEGNTFENLAPGPYTAYVRDKADPSNIVQSAFTITSPSEIAMTFAEVQSPKCVGSSDGSVTVDVTGGTAPYTYKVSTMSAFQPSNILTGLPAGEHEVVVKDANGCEKTGKVTIAPPTEIAVSFSNVVQPNCPADVSGGFTVSATGGSGGYKYKLSTQSEFGESPQFKDLAAGNYTVVVKDSNGCEKSGTVEITAKSTNPPVPIISVQGRDGIDGVVSLVSNSTTGNQWLVDGVEIPGATGQSLPITEPGNYQVRVTNAGGCSSISETTGITSSPEIGTLKIKAYPNPSEGIVIIDLGKEIQIDRVTIIHTTGTVMKTNSERMLTDRITLDMSTYQVGMYIIQIEGIGTFERIKIQKK